MLGIGEPAPHDSLQEWVLSMRCFVLNIIILYSLLILPLASYSIVMITTFTRM